MANAKWGKRLWLANAVLVCLVIASVAIHLLSLSCLDTRVANGYVQRVLREIALYLQRTVHEQGQLPLDLPDSLTAPPWLNATRLVLADPYHNVRSGTERLFKVTVDFAGEATESERDFSFEGAKLQYIRLTSSIAVLYSYGPDCDDDLGRLSSSEMSAWFSEYVSEGGTVQQGASAVHDPSKGARSDGDIVRVVILPE